MSGGGALLLPLAVRDEQFDRRGGIAGLTVVARFDFAKEPQIAIGELEGWGPIPLPRHMTQVDLVLAPERRGAARGRGVIAAAELSAGEECNTVD